jgi:hypothetical protein
VEGYLGTKGRTGWAKDGVAAVCIGMANEVRLRRNMFEMWRKFWKQEEEDPLI